MVTIQICIGSACHLKGSYQIIERLQQLVKENRLESKIEIKAAFCLGNCTNAVSAKIDDEDIISLSPETVDAYFKEDILRRIS